MPHIVAWTGERDSYYVGEDDDLAAIGCPHPAIESSGGYGEGRAIFGQGDPARQRAAFLQRRCQVCNGGLEGGALLLVESRTGPHSEPWLCRDCAAYALRVCPALSALKGLRVLEVMRGEVEVLTLNHEDGTPIAVFVALEPTEARETTVAEFLGSYCPPPPPNNAPESPV